jgi:hypothetical protein
MAAPQFVPAPDSSPRSYASPDHVPTQWFPDRPAELRGRQPQGDRLGNPGPDQGYGLLLAKRYIPKLKLQPGEHVADAVQGCLGVALRRAALFGRAPMVHDFTVAFTVFGFLDAAPPAELLEFRREAFEGVGHVAVHYAEGRAIADVVPEQTLRLSHQQVVASYPAQWRTLLAL